ncbi:MAG: hypothetical protein RLZZ450_1452 [Pseudomonadota bacterium]
MNALEAKCTQFARASEGALRRLLTRVLLLSLLVVGATGCVPSVVVRAPVMYPARVPVRAFPSILIAGNKLPEGDLAERLRAHLAKDGQHDVKRVEVADLESMREVGAISPLTLVVLVVPGIYDDPQEDWVTMPVQSCDFYYGCFTQYQSVYTQLPQLLGEVTLTVYEGPTAKTLQTATFDAAVYQPDSPQARAQVIDQLGKQLERAVDVLQSAIKVELESVDEHPIVRDAIASIQKGKWDEGRALLEQAALQLGGLKHSVQARILYDLAIARWYAPGPAGLTQAAFDAASRALNEAIQLDGSARYQRTQQRLLQARQRQQILDEQRRAATANYAMLPPRTIGSEGTLKGETPARP